MNVWKLLRFAVTFLRPILAGLLLCLIGLTGFGGLSE
jgi:hypothetical protein